MAAAAAGAAGERRPGGGPPRGAAAALPCTHLPGSRVRAGRPSRGLSRALLAACLYPGQRQLVFSDVFALQVRLGSFTVWRSIQARAGLRRTAAWAPGLASRLALVPGAAGCRAPLIHSQVPQQPPEGAAGCGKRCSEVLQGRDAPWQHRRPLPLHGASC